jgi:outer membrane protein TolC
VQLGPTPIIASAFFLAGILAQSVAAQQPMTLQEAFLRADQHAYANRMAGADRLVREGEGQATLRGILPTLRVEAGWMRTTDPLNAFGFALRQRAVTPAAFDPARLNHPAPTSNVASALILEQPLVNLDAWAGREAARRGVRASIASAQWTAEITRVQVVQAWFGGVLAKERVATLEAALTAARSHVRQASALLDQGMVTRADLLMAEVKAGELEADLVSARGELALMSRRLALAIGAPGDTSITVPGALPTTDDITETLSDAALSRGDPGLRGDVAAARLGQAAAESDLRRTRAAMLPRLNGFARYDWNSANALVSGDKAWTIGVMASWAPFSGGAELSAARAARGRVALAAAGADAVAAQAALDATERDNALAVARERLAIAERSVAQSAEAHRLVSRSYAGGLATVTELLGAAAAETGSRLARSAAVFQVIVAAAERQQAMGLSLDVLTALGR